MKYEDQEIIRLRSLERKKKFTNCITGMYADEILYKFNKMQAFEHYVFMMPETFQEMDPILAIKKYPSGCRPQLILTDGTGTINFTFSLYRESVEPGTTEAAIEQLKTIIKTMHPTYRFTGGGSMDGKNYHLSWTEFNSNSLDGGVFNLLTVISFSDSFMIGMFNCPLKEKHSWKPIMLEVLNTVESEVEG